MAIQSDPVNHPARDGKLGVSPAGFPRHFDSYVLLKPLARGGMGQLYLALTGTRGPGEAVRGQAGAARGRRARERAPLPRRGDGRAAAVARQPGDGVRRRPAGRPDLPGDGLRRRARSARRLESLRRAPRPVPGRHRRLHHQGAVPRARLRARVRGPEAGPSRRLAGQRAAVVLGRGEADRLRAGDVDAEAREDRARDHLRQAQLPGARAGAARARSTGAPICTRPGSCCGSC